MARIRTFKPEFWQDRKLASLSPHARLLALALLQLCDANGVFLNITMQIHAHAFPWEAKVKVPSLLGELEGIGYVKFYSIGGKDYGIIPGFRKHQRLGGKEAQSDGLFPLPNQEDRECEAEGKEPVLPGEAVGNAGTGNREQGTGNTRAKRFTPPSQEEVSEYCRERGNSVDAKRFVDFYESKGWMIGKNRMKDWTAAVRTWERKDKQENQSVGVDWSRVE